MGRTGWLSAALQGQRAGRRIGLPEQSQIEAGAAGGQKRSSVKGAGIASRDLRDHAASGSTPRTKSMTLALLISHGLRSGPEASVV